MSLHNAGKLINLSTMRIALITDGVSPYVVGGIQRHSALLAQHLARLGVQVDLYHTDCGNGHWNEARTLQGFPPDTRERITSYFVDYPAPQAFPGHYFVESLAFSQRLFEQYLKAPRADFIYAKGFTGWAFLKAKREKVDLPKIGVNAHGYEMFQRAPDFRTGVANFLFRHYFRSISRRADVVFSYGEKITEILKSRVGVSPDRIVEIPTGVDANWIRAEVVPVHRPVRFIFLGRYERRKGIEEISQVLRNSTFQRRFSMDFIGPIPEQHQLRMEGIKYHGLVTEPVVLQNLLDACDVLLCPSYSEGMPNVIMEAMARGLAIIATDVGAVRLMVGPDNGLLLPYPSVQLIRQAMEQMAELPAAELVALKKASLCKVQQFTWDRVAQFTLEQITARVN
jgi:glycosyltransferase involved in cell wall biosynthesis